jgi:hypothetical protein
MTMVRMTSVCLSVCDGRFGGWGKGQGGEAAGDPFHSLDQSTQLITHTPKKTSNRHQAGYLLLLLPSSQGKAGSRHPSVPPSIQGKEGGEGARPS